MDLTLPVAAELATICVNLDEQIDRHEPLIYCLGGYATVYKGTFRVDGMKIAMKTEGFLRDGSAIERILSEARIWSKLHHENIVPLLGFTTIFNTSVSLVSPWQDRGNAHDYVQDRAVDPRPLLLGVARGLDYLHSHALGPIVHSDLKGQNVLISGDGRALITDFGLSFLAEPSASVTRSGGTPKWMAPEIHDNGVASVHSDMWAFGMTTLELFTRQEPFHGIPTMAAIVGILKGPPGRPVAELTCDRLTDAWWSICMRCWQQDPASRPSASDVLADIERAISTNALNSSSCLTVDDARQVTSSNRLICLQGVNFEDPMDQGSSALDRELVAMGARHFDGAGAMAIGDHPISPTIDIGITLSSVDHPHYTSHVVSSIQATDDLQVISTLPSLKGHTQSDWRAPFDIEVNKPRSTQFEPANSIQLAPAAQPFLEVAGARHFGMVFRHGSPVDLIYNRRFFVAFIAIIAVHMLAVWFGLSEGTFNLTTLSRIGIP